MINSIRNVCQTYYNELPADGFKKIGLSAAVSFAASTVLSVYLMSESRNQIFARAAVAAGMAAIAGAIHVLTKPIFNYLCDNTANRFNPYQEFMATAISLACTQTLVNHFTAMKVNLWDSAYFNGYQFFPALPIHLPLISVHFIDRICGWLNPNTMRTFADLLQNFGIDIHSNAPPFYVMI